jgi:hypothetical protein
MKESPRRVSRSRDARSLQLALQSATGVPIEVRWDASGGSIGWKWHVIWSDGPTVAAMRAHVDLAGAGLAALDVEQLVYQRIVQPMSFAITMVRNVRLGQPALGDHRSVWLLASELDDTNYPEQASVEDLALARVLARLSDHLEADMPAVLDRRGLAGLRNELAPPSNVLPFRRTTRWVPTNL